jgi:WD40 repeat protein
LAPDAPPPSVDFQLVATLDDTMGPVYSLAWSPDGSTLATAAYQNLYLWDPDAGVVTEVLRGHTDFIWGVSWRPDGSMIATASWDRTVRIWRTSNMTEIASVSTGDAMCVAWSPSGHQLAIGTTGGSIVIWDPAVQLVVREWPVGSLVIDAEWSPDGSMLLVGDLIGRVSLYDAVSGELLDRFVTPVFSNDANGVTWSADGSTAVSAHQDGTIWMWNIDSGEPVRTLAAHGGWARGLDFSPDGWWLATTGMDAKADVWWTANWGLMVPLSEPPRAMWCAEWSPDGTKLAVGSGHYDSTAMGATYIWRITEQPASD